MVPAGEFGDKLVITAQPSVDKTINSTGRIGPDGSILLLEVGRLEASGKTLNELRSEVRNILIRNGLSPRFQMEINEFKSQKIYLTINSSSKVIFLESSLNCAILLKNAEVLPSRDTPARSQLVIQYIIKSLFYDLCLIFNIAFLRLLGSHFCFWD